MDQRVRTGADAMWATVTIFFSTAVLVLAAVTGVAGCKLVFENRNRNAQSTLTGIFFIFLCGFFTIAAIGLLMHKNDRPFEIKNGKVEIPSPEADTVAFAVQVNEFNIRQLRAGLPCNIQIPKDQDDANAILIMKRNP